MKLTPHRRLLTLIGCLAILITGSILSSYIRRVQVYLYVKR